MVAFIGPATRPALPHHDEAGEKDGFNRHHAVQQGKRWGIEVGYPESIDQNPDREPHGVNGNEAQASDEGAQRVSKALGRRASGQKLFFVPEDDLNVLF